MHLSRTGPVGARVLLALVGVLLVAAVAASVVLTSAAAGRPTGPEVRDAAAGVTYSLPEGWQQATGGLVYGSSGGTLQTTKRDGSVLLVGVLDGKLFAAGESSTQAAARRLAVDFGEFFVPISGVRDKRLDEATTVDGRRAWVAGYTIVPKDTGTRSATDVRATVIEDGDRRVFAVLLSSPSDPQLLAKAQASITTLRFS